MTAYGEDASKFAKKPLDASDGVQCESCHGPGSLYKKKKTMADHDASVAAGMWEPTKETCTGCHNEESPSFAGFNYEESLKKIAHPIPAEVKGKYAEVEKKLRDEKKKAAE
jgi:formate-dependent nitrite reductase cytochrome c552 subunit